MPEFSSIWCITQEYGEICVSIKTTHVGSLPRPPDLIKALEADPAFQHKDNKIMLERDVCSVTKSQHNLGLTVINDGEFSKTSYVNYIKDRYSGFSGTKSDRNTPQDLAEFPEYAQYLKESGAHPRIDKPSCISAVHLIRADIVDRDLDNLCAALQKVNRDPSQAFVNVPSPGIVALFLKNEFYNSHDEYLEALSVALRVEYSKIINRGFNLQIDCPDLAMSRHIFYSSLSLSDFKKRICKHIEYLNNIICDFDSSKCRVHVCWGNYPGPHHYDIDFIEIASTVFSCHAQTILFEAANPRHAHEFEDLRKIRIPDDKILAPGVIDVKTNYIEHPRLIGQRIKKYTNLVGKERVIASTDCGFSSFSGCCHVDSAIVWEKLKTLTLGAKLAEDDKI